MTTQKESIPSRGLTLVTIGWIGLFLYNVGQFALGVILPYLYEEYGFDPVTVGANLSSISWLTRAIVYLPLALVAARMNPKYFLGAIFVLLGVALILFGTGKSVNVIYLARGLIALAGAAIIPPLALVKTNWIPLSRLGGINGIENALSTAGQYFALAVTVPLIGILGSWHRELALLGGIGVLAGVLWIALFAENPAKGKIVPAEKKPFLAPLKEALTYRSVPLLAIGWPGTTLVWIALTTFWPTYATETFGMSLALTGTLIAMIPLGSFIGSLTAPKIADMIGVDKWMIWPWGLLLPIFYFIPIVVNNAFICGLSFFIAGYGAYAFVPVSITHVNKLPGISPQGISIGLAVIFTLTSVGGTLAGVIVRNLNSSMGMAGALKLCCLSPLIWFATTIFLPEYGRKAMEKKAQEENAS